MVGGGIFAVLGLAAVLSRGGTPVAFAIAGLVALLTSYSYARLSVAFPSQGGTVEFLNQAFGPGLVTGSLNILLWLSYIVMLSLYARAFGGYAASFFPAAAQAHWQHVFITLIVILLTALNAVGAAAVGAVERWIVAVKVSILALFAGAGVWSIHYARLAPPRWASPLHLITGGMIIFLAYEGFELIANTAADVREPRKTLPRAYYTAVGFVILLYVVVAAVTVGNLPIPQIAAAEDYALAAAAKPFLGSAGFILIAVAALLSTSSAINATLYGAGRLSYIIAKEGELPEALEKKVWRKPIEGLLITSALTLITANGLDLSAISVAGSAGFLLIFCAVNAANLRLHRKLSSSPALAALGALACAASLAALLWQSASGSPMQRWALPAMLALSFAIEGAYRLATRREIRTCLPRIGEKEGNAPCG